MSISRHNKSSRMQICVNMRIWQRELVVHPSYIIIPEPTFHSTVDVHNCAPAEIIHFPSDCNSSQCSVPTRFFLTSVRPWFTWPPIPERLPGPPWQFTLVNHRLWYPYGWKIKRLFIIATREKACAWTVYQNVSEFETLIVEWKMRCKSVLGSGFDFAPTNLNSQNRSGTVPWFQKNHLCNAGEFPTHWIKCLVGTVWS